MQRVPLLTFRLANNPPALAQVIRAPRGRGSQLNAGWRRAKGDWVLFLHADSQLPPGYNALLQQQLAAAARQQQRPWWQPFGGGQQQAAAERERALAWGAGACGAQCQSEQRQPRRPWWLLGGDGSVGSSGTCKCGGGSGSPQCSGDMCSSRGSGAGACAPPAWGCFSSIRATEVRLASSASYTHC